MIDQKTVATIQVQPKQGQNGQNFVSALLTFHKIASKSDLEVMIAFLREVQNRIHVKCG